MLEYVPSHIFGEIAADQDFANFNSKCIKHLRYVLLKIENVNFVWSGCEWFTRC